MAERQGFEPWETRKPRRFSRPLPSTTQPSLQKQKDFPYYNSLLDMQELSFITKEILKEEIFLYTFYGSPDWIRTSDQTINSRLLYR